MPQRCGQGTSAGVLRVRAVGWLPSLTNELRRRLKRVDEVLGPDLATHRQAVDDTRQGVGEVLRPVGGVVDPPGLRVDLQREQLVQQRVIPGHVDAPVVERRFQHLVGMGRAVHGAQAGACLIFIAGTWRRILITITGFTLAHTLTLTLAALDLARLPIPPIEAVIALSIVFLAREIALDRRDTLTIDFMTVQYEAVVDDQEAMSRTIIDFCGLPWDDACLRYYESSRQSRTLSYDQVRRPIYKSSVGRAERFAAHLGPLRNALDAGP